MKKITQTPKSYNKSMIMTRAHKIRKATGVDMSAALIQAWAEIKEIRQMKKDYWKRANEIKAEQYCGFTTAKKLAEVEIKEACKRYIA